MAEDADLVVDSFNLKELDNVVEDGEGDDGQDVAQPRAHVQLLENIKRGVYVDKKVSIMSNTNEHIITRMLLLQLSVLFIGHVSAWYL